MSQRARAGRAREPEGSSGEGALAKAGWGGEPSVRHVSSTPVFELLRESVRRCTRLQARRPTRHCHRPSPPHTCCRAAGHPSGHICGSTSARRPPRTGGCALGTCSWRRRSGKGVA